MLADQNAAVVIGCRVSVALTRGPEDLQTLLNYEAKPYVSMQLRMLFDVVPYKYYADPPPIDVFFKSRHMVNDVCPWMSQLKGSLRPPPPAFRNLGAAERLRKSIPPQKSNSAPAYLVRQVKKYTRLLLLEECAMEDQIRWHDMFNVHYQFAIFEEGSHNRIQYRLHDSLPRRETNLETLPISSNPKKTYRGPHVRSIFPDVDNTGVLNHRVMLVLNVPGLPEERPSLVFGDVVYIRFACMDNIEFAGFVVATEATRCMLAMPKEFYACCVPNPRSHTENAIIRKIIDSTLDATKAKDFSLVHVRFGFDRIRMQRMHAALQVALEATTFKMLPPDVQLTALENPLSAGLPSQEEVLAAARGSRESERPLPTVTSCRHFANTMQIVGGKNLNAEQRWAIASFIMGAGIGAPFTIYGPPGTGKTVTLVECALQILKKEGDAKLLLCAPQGYSADLLASALADAGLKPTEMMRIADPRHPPVQMKEDVLNYFSNFNAVSKAFELPEPSMVASKRVVVMTCGAAGILRCGDYGSYHRTCKTGYSGRPSELAGIEFSHVLIDEAGQALVPEALSPITLLNPQIGKALLCGDPKQLGPVVRSLQAAVGGDSAGLSVSLLECFINYNTSQATAKRIAGLAPATATLVQNYRSHSTLLDIPNTLFYKGALMAAADQSQLLPPSWSELKSDAPQTQNHQVPDWGDALNLQIYSETRNGRESKEHVDSLLKNTWHETEEIKEETVTALPSTLFFGVRGQQMREGEAPSYFNPIEATTLVELLQGLLEQHQTQSGRPAVGVEDIGVIATYRKQVQKIRLQLRARGLGGIRVGTVDDMQGQEERIIFISTVLSKPETLPPVTGGKDSDLHLGFWRNPRRFNVAITRAKVLLVVLGHPSVLVEDPNWREVLRFCTARGAYRGAGSEAMTKLLRGDGANSAEYPGLTDALAAAKSGEHEGDLAAAVSQIAEMALLGAGHAAHMFPESLDEFNDAHGGETQWRVVL